MLTDCLMIGGPEEQRRSDRQTLTPQAPSRSRGMISQCGQSSLYAKCLYTTKMEYNRHHLKDAHLTEKIRMSKGPKGPCPEFKASENVCGVDGFKFFEGMNKPCLTPGMTKDKCPRFIKP